MLPLVTGTPTHNDQRAPWHADFDLRFGGVVWRGREGENCLGEEVEGDQPLPPQPAVVQVRVYAGTSLWPVVQITEFHGFKITESIHLLGQALHQSSAEGREAIKLPNLHFMSLEIDFGSVVLLEVVVVVDLEGT